MFFPPRHYFKIPFMQNRSEASLCSTARKAAPARRDKRYHLPAVAARCDIPAAAAEVVDRLRQKQTTNADCNKLHVRLDPWTTFYISTELRERARTESTLAVFINLFLYLIKKSDFFLLLFLSPQSCTNHYCASSTKKNICSISKTTKKNRIPSLPLIQMTTGKKTHLINTLN